MEEVSAVSTQATLSSVPFDREVKSCLFECYWMYDGIMLAAWFDH
jgi:hypothetical protein